MKVKRRVVLDVTDWELSNLILQTYGVGYTILASETYQPFIESGLISKWGKERLEYWKETGVGNYMLSIILRDLLRRGLIKAGNYNVIYD